MPKESDAVISVGMGTGIAPIRALFQERLVKKREGKTVAPGAFVFGNRKASEEYYYREEVELWQEEGVLNDLWTAFSRDQAKKIYVQNRMQENLETVYDYVYKNKAFFYLCGTAASSITDCR